MEVKTGAHQESPTRFYDRIAQTYDLERFGCRCGLILNDTEVGIVSNLIPRGSKLLDVGAGTGRFSIAAAGIASEVVTVDSSRRMTIQTRTRGTSSSASARISPVLGDAGSLPFHSATFDVVISVKLLSHYGDITPYVREMARVLKPGGKLVLDVPHRFAPFYRRFVTNGVIRSHPDYPHSRGELRKIFKRNSIVVTQSLTYAALPTSVVHLLMCGHPGLISDRVLRLVYSDRKGFLAFVEGTKQR